MNEIELFACGMRKRCGCEPITFDISKVVEEKKRGVFTRKKNPTIFDQMFPIRYKNVTETKYLVHCSQCGVLYFCSSTKAWLVENLRKNKINYREVNHV